MIKIPLSEATPKGLEFGSKVVGGEIFALYGNLGSGKTTFSKALGKALKIKQTITSPTFVLMQEYQAKNPGSNKTLWLYHADLYRIKNQKEFAGLGITERWGQPEVVTIIEWAEKIESLLPKNTVRLKFFRDIE